MGLLIYAVVKAAVAKRQDHRTWIRLKRDEVEVLNYLKAHEFKASMVLMSQELGSPRERIRTILANLETRGSISIKREGEDDTF